MLDILYIQVEKVEKELLDPALRPELKQLLSTIDVKTREFQNGGMIENWVKFAKSRRDGSVNIEQVKKNMDLLKTLRLEDFRATVGNLNVHDNKRANAAANRVAPAAQPPQGAAPSGTGAAPPAIVKLIPPNAAVNLPPGTLKDTLQAFFEEAFDFQDADNDQLMKPSECKVPQLRDLFEQKKIPLNDDGYVTKQSFVQVFMGMKTPAATIEEWSSWEATYREWFGLPRKLSFASGGGGGPNSNPDRTTAAGIM